MAGFNHTWNLWLTECITKEDTARTSFEEKRLHKKGDRRLQALGVTPRGAQALPSPLRPHTTPTPTRSAAVRFLEEKVGIDVLLGPDGMPERPPTRELLYRGVSQDGQGRSAYLKARRKYGVLERNGCPLTATQDYGLGKNDVAGPSEYVASPNCRKPIIMRSFFRTQGVDTYKDLPVFR